MTLNACILHSSLHPTKTDKSLRAFQEALVAALCVSNTERVVTGDACNRLDGKFHAMAKGETQRVCCVHTRRVKTLFLCSDCNAAMCPGECFTRYHTLKHYYWDDENKEGNAERLRDINGRPPKNGAKRKLSKVPIKQRKHRKIGVTTPEGKKK